MRKYNNYIDGKFTPARNGGVIPVINPATEEIISEVPDSTKEDIAKAIEAAYAARKDWRDTPSIERGEYIKKLCEDIGMTVKIFGYSNKVYDFTLKLLSPVIPENIKELEEGGRKKIIISVPSEKMGKVIGKRGNKLEKIRFLLERRFNVKEVNIIQAI